MSELSEKSTELVTANTQVPGAAGRPAYVPYLRCRWL
jgi:hypothetical protein